MRSAATLDRMAMTTYSKPKRYFKCPLCDRVDTAALRERDDTGGWGEDWYIGCLRCEAEMRGPEYLRQLADYIGCTTRDLLMYADELLTDAGVLDPDSGGHPNQNGDLKPLPSEDTLWEYAAALQTSNGPLSYLESRGISRAVRRRTQVGLNKGGRLTFPMRDGAGQLVAVKYRRPTPYGQMRNIGGSGRDWPLYPWPAKKHSRCLLICAGELDALCALSHGLDACSVTLGASAWRHAWTAAVYLRRVVIVFDNGEQDGARRLCDGLLAAGVDARIASLQRLGLTDRKADLSDYLLGGGHPNELLKGEK